MAGKTANWKPGPTVCRCCLAEGCYKDISTEYFWMGKREVYAEMLTNTFNVSIAFSQSGGPNSNSRLICEPCISRLRDASNFKRQVLDCEKTFMQHLDPGSSLSHQDLPEELAGLDDAVKVERVKIERDAPSDDDFDATPDFLDDDDDELDQPLTNFATKEPKKEAVSLLEELLDNPAVTIKKKSVVKTKQPPAKKVKRTETAKPTSSKVVVKTATAEKKKKEQMTQNSVHRNAHRILQYTTAYPFRMPDSSMLCVYCWESFDDPAVYRDHHRKEHQIFKVSHAYSHIRSGEGYVKADITEFSCRICNTSLDTLENAAEHLVQKHKKIINFDCDLGVMPFKIYKNKYACAICDSKFRELPILSKHTNIHFAKFTCELCGKSYATSTALNNHVKFKCARETDLPICRRCKTTFPNNAERMKHLHESKRCSQHVCNLCADRFPTWGLKQAHMRERHGAPKKTYKCPECDVTYEQRHKLRQHFTLKHTDKYLTCSMCDMKFDSNSKLQRHMPVHTGEKNFTCHVCTKSFARRSGLTQHMWIHSKVKKASCTICDKHFNQRVCWKAHMKSRHPELCNF